MQNYSRARTPRRSVPVQWASAALVDHGAKRNFPRTNRIGRPNRLPAPGRPFEVRTRD